MLDGCSCLSPFRKTLRLVEANSEQQSFTVRWANFRTGGELADHHIHDIHNIGWWSLTIDIWDPQMVPPSPVVVISVVRNHFRPEPFTDPPQPHKSLPCLLRQLHQLPVSERPGVLAVKIETIGCDSTSLGRSSSFMSFWWFLSFFSVIFFCVIRHLRRPVELGEGEERPSPQRVVLHQSSL